MDISPVRTEDDYRKALKRAGDIWDAQPGTLEADELEVLLPLTSSSITRKPITLSTLPTPLRLSRYEWKSWDLVVRTSNPV
jgi:hypothetical protein